MTQQKDFTPIDFNDYSSTKILTWLYSGSNPLAMKWSNNRPFNVSSGVDYNGVNRLLLSISPFKDSRFATSKQFKFYLGCPPIKNVTHKEKGLRRGFPFALFSVEQFPNFDSDYFPVKEPNTTYVENDNFVEAVHNLVETVENAVTVNFELLTAIILARFMAQDINYPLGKIATSNKQWIKFLESDNTAICKASAEAQKRYNKILADCGLEDCITKAPEKSIVSKFGDSYKDAIAKLKVESERIAELTPEPKAEPKPTPKPKAEPMSDFAKAVNMDAINKLSQKDLKRVLAILEKV